MICARAFDRFLSHVHSGARHFSKHIDDLLYAGELPKLVNLEKGDFLVFINYYIDSFREAIFMSEYSI